MGSPTVTASVRPGYGPTTIRPGEVHAWVLGLDQPIDESGEFLDGAERQRAQRYLGPRDRARFAASRAGLKLILAGYLGTDPASLRFAFSTDGRPQLAYASPRLPEFNFSLSRSGNLALVAVALGGVGADAEQIVPRPGLADLVAATFGAREASCIKGGCSGSPLRSFYRHWTGKEAFLKALGSGLAGLRDTELCCDAGPAIWFGGRPVEGWTVSLVDVSPEYAAAVVAHQPVAGCWRLMS